MLTHLLVPLDGTRMAEAVLPLVGVLAQKSGARVTLLHVLEQAPPAAVHGQSHLRSADEANAYLKKIAEERFLEGATVDWHVHQRRIPDVAHSLADHAEELQPDLIVMTNHGHRWIRDRLFGTIAQQVIQQTSIPVLMVRLGADGTAPQTLGSFIVPLDGQPEHEAALPITAELARLLEATMRLIMVVPTRGTLSGSPAAVGQLLPWATEEVLDLTQQYGVDYLAARLEELHAAEVQAVATVARGDPLDVLPQAIAQYGGDLVALGTHGAAGTTAFWSGSLGQRLLGSVAVSFLLVPVPRQG